MCRFNQFRRCGWGYDGYQYWTKRRLFLFPKRHSTTAYLAFALCGTVSHVKEDMQKDVHRIHTHFIEGTWGSKDFDIYEMSQGPGTNPPWMPTTDCTLLESLKKKQNKNLSNAVSVINSKGWFEPLVITNPSTACILLLLIANFLWSSED